MFDTVFLCLLILVYNWNNGAKNESFEKWDLEFGFHYLEPTPHSHKLFKTVVQAF